MENLYTYYNYEDAYYHMQYNKCIEIAKYLLPKIKNNPKVRELEDKLYDTYDSIDNNLLGEIKIWLMVYENFY